MHKTSILLAIGLTAAVGAVACVKHPVSEQERVSNFCFPGFLREAVANGYLAVDDEKADRIIIRNPFTGVYAYCPALVVTEKGRKAAEEQAAKNPPPEQE